MIRVVRGGRGRGVCWGVVVGGEVGAGILMVRVLGMERGREKERWREGGREEKNFGGNGHTSQLLVTKCRVP